MRGRIQWIAHLPGSARMRPGFVVRVVQLVEVILFQVTIFPAGAARVGLDITSSFSCAASGQIIAAHPARSVLLDSIAA